MTQGSGSLGSRPLKQHSQPKLHLQEAASVSQGTSAKLMRFASALKVDTKHQVALATSCIAKNMAVANYG